MKFFKNDPRPWAHLEIPGNVDWCMQCLTIAGAITRYEHKRWSVLQGWIVEDEPPYGYQGLTAKANGLN